MKKVHVYHVPSQKISAQFYEITSNFKEQAKFPSRIKTIVSRKFSRITNTISEQKISQDNDNDKDKDNVTTDLYQAKQADKPRII